jgi:hypothetical protein
MESLPPVSMPVVNPAKPATTSFGDEDILNPFSMSFASMAGIDMSASSSQSDVHLQVREPPLDPFYFVFIYFCGIWFLVLTTFFFTRN